jgi:branched-chain amino acid transport system substrate-binding protein
MDLGFQVTKFTGDSFSPSLFEIAPGISDYYTTQHFHWEDPDLQRILQNYIELHGNEYPELNVAMGYDMVYFLKAVLESAESLDPEHLRLAFANATEIQLAHALITIDPTTHNPKEKDVVIVRVEDDYDHFVERFRPSELVR